MKEKNRRNNSTLLGTVQDVAGTTISVILKDSFLSGLTFVNGQGYRVGQIGSFVRIPIGYIDLFGIVSQVGASAVPENMADQEPYGKRWLKVQLIGEGFQKGHFQRGISQYPTIEDEVHLVSEESLSAIYGEKEEQSHLVKVGHIAGSESIDALININKLVTRHSAIVGTTGSGKSTTVSSILRSLSDEKQFPSARIIVLDIHGEYGNALKDKASIFKVNPDERKPNEHPLHIPFWAMSFEELMNIAFGKIKEEDKGKILEFITELKLKSHKNNDYSGVSSQNLTVDTPIPFSIKRLWLYLHRLIKSTHIEPPGSGQEFCDITDDFDHTKTTEALLKNEETGEPVESGDASTVTPPKYKVQVPREIYLSGQNLNISRQLDSLATKLRDPRYDFLFDPGDWAPNIEGDTDKDLSSLFKSWIGSENPVTVLDLSGVPIPIMNDIIGILLRILYDGLFWSRNLSQGGKERPLLVVMEEAHSYLNNESMGSASEIVQRIVKEGRKYGIGAMIVSQRPSEIDPTILSQCGTFITQRLSNSTDRSHITGAISDNLEGLTDMLPVLRTGEAIVLGESVKLPMRSQIEAPPIGHRPDSQDPVVSDPLGPEESMNPGGWGIPMEDDPNYEEFMLVWRQKDPKLPRDWNQNEEE